MNRLSTWIFGLLGGLLLTAGCETSLDWEFDSLPKLTIVAHPYFQTFQGTPHVSVYSSLSPQDGGQFYTPSQLEVEITEFESGISFKLDSTRRAKEVYFEFPSNFLKEGFSYSIKAFAPGFEPVHATTRIPKPSRITDLEVKDVVIAPSEKNEFKNILHYNVEFNIQHESGNRYYHLLFYNAYSNNPDEGVYLNPELTDNIAFIANVDYGVLVDAQDLEAGVPLKFSFVDWTVENSDLQLVYVELRSVTADYYKYYSSLARQVIVRQDPFAEPVTIYNNIEGGYGNFSGFSPNVSSSTVPH